MTDPYVVDVPPIELALSPFEMAVDGVPVDHGATVTLSWD